MDKKDYMQISTILRRGTRELQADAPMLQVAAFYINKFSEYLKNDNKEFDEEKRTEQLREIFQYIAYQSYDITMPVIHNFMAWQPWVKNYHTDIEISYANPGPSLSRIWIDQDLKDDLGY